MAEQENSKDLISVLWSGADILRSKMDANEYKDYLLGIVFYKYLSDSFLIRVYDLIYDEKPETLKIALDAYREALEDESAEELKDEINSACHYVIDPDLTYTCFADADHLKVYQKRPIYWLFDSGKKNGFKCLIYIHRYKPDTIARIRTDYVHEQQARYRTAIARTGKPDCKCWNR